MSISVLGAGAFGTALAISLASEDQGITLWARDPADMQTSRQNKRRLPGVEFPTRLTATGDLKLAAKAEVLLLAVPMQQLSGFLRSNAAMLAGKTLVACCKGIDLDSGLGPVEIIRRQVPDATPAILSGPSFAVDIASGLPTALTLAADGGVSLQQALSTRNLRIYRSNDLVGVELGGALKNVVAIACGIAIGAGLGESARAALMTRGYTEMQRFAVAQGADAETLAGLSGFGDLALTCASENPATLPLALRLAAPRFCRRAPRLRARPLQKRWPHWPVRRTSTCQSPI